jgi:Transposase, Mutator family/Transposase IS116/IS110/IS902 family
VIAATYLAGTNTRRVRRALAGLFGGAIGKDVVSRAWHKVQTDWQAWQKRDLSKDDIVRLILDGTMVRVRLHKRATGLSVLVALGVRRDGQKVLLGLKNMGGESEAAWRAFLDELSGRRDLLLSVVGVGETLAASLLAEMPQPGVLRRSGEMVAYAGLSPSHHRSGSSIDRPTRISKIGNATLRSSLYMPALSAMRFNPAVAALVARLKGAGRLKPKQIVVAAMRKLLVHCFGVLKTGKRFDPTIAMAA